MMLGERIPQLRRETNFPQGDVEKRTGLLRCYTSRVEGGHTVPSLETIQKHAYAFEIPLYRFFVTDGEPDVQSMRAMPKAKQSPRISEIDEDIRMFARLFARIKDEDRKHAEFEHLKIQEFLFEVLSSAPPRSDA